VSCREGTEFKYTLVIGAWGGEEQGLVGSRAYAQACKARGDNILAMLQADMIG
jgi:Zn-dependent M28 family amino/carboxypeptidase